MNGGDVTGVAGKKIREGRGAVQDDRSKNGELDNKINGSKSNV